MPVVHQVCPTHQPLPQIVRAFDLVYCRCGPNLLCMRVEALMPQLVLRLWAFCGLYQPIGLSIQALPNRSGSKPLLDPDAPMQP